MHVDGGVNHRTAEIVGRHGIDVCVVGSALFQRGRDASEEVELVRQRTGCGNIEYLHEVGLTGSDVALAHCVHTDDDERALLRETDTRVLHCPSANLKLGSGIAPIPEYLALGLTVSLGADGAPCNNRLDAFTEMRTAALVQKRTTGKAGALVAESQYQSNMTGGGSWAAVEEEDNAARERTRRVKGEEPA